MHLKDTLSQKLVQLNGDRVLTVYSCGPTVYDYPHLGNWYAFLRWDLLVRTLESSGLRVKWVMNITDVGHLTSDADEGQDKLAVSAAKKKTSAYDLAQYYTDYFLNSLQTLNFRQPDHLPRATQHIKEQIELVQNLEKLNLTYVIDDGVYYDTSRFPNYEQLYGGDRAGFLADARVSNNPQKRHPSDFALWKLTPPGQKRDMEWDSPWGRGFPGWHLECSAMAHAYLGAPLDIHAGGIDHIPIHHTNELAQSEPVYGQPMAKIWLHSNFITVNGQKMSKSLNNFYTLEDIQQKGYDPEVLRIAVFQSRYFKETDFNWALLRQAQNRYQRLRLMSCRRFQLQNHEQASIIRQSLQKTLRAIKDCLQDNLNSPAALEGVDSLIKQIGTQALPQELRFDLDDFCQKLDSFFGLSLSQIDDLDNNQKTLLKKRQTAKDKGDYQRADELRRQLTLEHVEILDTPLGQIWHK